MQITIKLGGPLRERVKGHLRGEMTLELPEKARVTDALAALGLDGDQVRVLMLNGQPIADNRPLANGDRLALFPRELAYNTMTAISFFNPLVREKKEDKKGQ